MSARDGAVGAWLAVVSLLALTGAVGCATAPGGERQPVVEKLDVNGNHVLSDSEIEKRILTAPTGWWPFATFPTGSPGAARSGRRARECSRRG